MDEYSIAFGAHLRSLRLKQGLSQEEVAHRAGLHVTYLSGIERGQSNPFYGNFFQETGFRAEMAAILQAVQRGDAAAAADAVTEKMQDQAAAVGTAEQCAAALEKRRRMGLQLPVVAPFTVGDVKVDYRKAIEAFGG